MNHPPPAQWPALALAAAITGLAVSGCSRIPESERAAKSGKPAAAATTSPAPAPPQEKSDVQTFIEGATGKTAVDAGKRARETIERVKTEHNADAAEAGAY